MILLQFSRTPTPVGLKFHHRCSTLFAFGYEEIMSPETPSGLAFPDRIDLSNGYRDDQIPWRSNGRADARPTGQVGTHSALESVSVGFLKIGATTNSYNT